MKVLWLVTYFTALLWSVVQPHDYFTWTLEAAPALIGAVTALVVLSKVHDRQMALLRTGNRISYPAAM